MLVDRVHPEDGFRLFDRFDLQVHDDGFVVAANQNAFQRLIRAGVDFLMRDIGRDEDEVAGFGFRLAMSAFGDEPPEAAK